MSIWIEINLPWNIDHFDDSQDQVVLDYRKKIKELNLEIEKRGIAHFGKSPDDVDLTLEEKDQLHKFRYDLEKSSGFNIYSKEFKVLYHTQDNPLIKKSEDYIDFMDSWYDWLITQPECIENSSRLKIEEELREYIDSKSFTGRKLNQPGTLIKIKNEEDVVKYWLIGHTNCSGGGCNDCPNVTNESIILAYKKLDLPKLIEG